MKNNIGNDENISSRALSFYPLRVMAGLTRAMTRETEKHTLSLCFFIVLTLLNIGCNDLLNERVDNRTSIHTLDDMQATLRGLNPQANYWFTEQMTDNYEYTENYSLSNSLFQRYIFLNTKESLAVEENFWYDYFMKIQRTWIIIDRAKKYKARHEEEKRRHAILGTALAIKAYCNFMLVNLFAPPYEEATKTAPGIPLVKAYTGKAIERYPTVSVQEVYDSVEQDLLTALPLMDDNQWLNTKFNFNKTAAYALLSRFYLFKQEWEKAVLYADSVINSRAGRLDPLKLDNASLFTNHVKVMEYSKKFFNPSNSSYLLMSHDTQILLSNPEIGFYPDPIDDFLKKNGKKEVMWYIDPGKKKSYPKKLFYYNHQQHVAVFPLFSVDEAYYNRAEAYIRLDSLYQAKKDLGKILSFDAYSDKKWTGKLHFITHKDTLMNYLLDSKRMRFFSEGMRWFDMRRHRVPVTRKLPGGKTFSIDGTDPKAYAIKFPLGEVNFWR